MKISVEIDASSQEVREALGLPDLRGVQDRVIAKVEERMNSMVDDYDPTKSVKMVFPEGMQVFENVQNSILEALNIGSKSKGGESK